jgi:hypothetical protein
MRRAHACAAVLAHAADTLCSFASRVAARGCAAAAATAASSAAPMCAATAGAAPPPEPRAAPILGEVPQPLVASGRSFWLDFDMAALPPEYRFDALEPHYRELPVIYAALRRDAGLGVTGSWASRKLRATNLVPGLLDSLPFKQAPIHLVLPTAQLHSTWRPLQASFPNQLCLLHVVEFDEALSLNDHAQEVAARVERGWAPTPLHTFQASLCCPLA